MPEEIDVLHEGAFFKQIALHIDNTADVSMVFLLVDSQTP
jgi:hypothetical protein